MDPFDLWAYSEELLPTIAGIFFPPGDIIAFLEVSNFICERL